MRALAFIVLFACGKDEPPASKSPEPPRGPSYMMVDELVARDPAQVRGEVRVHGWVVNGSIAEMIDSDQRVVHAFRLEKQGKSFPVVIRGPVPDTFRDAAEIVATGTIVRGADKMYALEATEIATKCPSKYDGRPGPAKYE